MNTRETLLASLEAIGTADNVQLANESAYLDWSILDGDGSRVLEVGNDDGAVQVRMTRGEMLTLHAALTRTLLAAE